ncbi:MAG: hypothetical protein HQ557_07740 [Bacteroidetes bacterium]|nr:hypothetical protein [Bacteroidota bacterium]
MIRLNRNQQNSTSTKKERTKMGVRRIIIFLAFLLAAGLVASVIMDILKNRSYNTSHAQMQIITSLDENLLLYQMENNLEYSSEAIEQICTNLNSRHADSDYRLPSLLRVMHDYSDALSENDYKLIKKTLLGYKYWMNDAGSDNMVFWSESHQILFAAAEYLAGQLFPDSIFTNAQLSGVEHMNRARNRILTWLQQRWDYGFSEWLSPSALAEDLTVLCNLVDFAQDEEIVLKSSMIMDLIIFDIAANTVDGVFAAPGSSRINDPVKSPPSPLQQILESFSENTYRASDLSPGFQNGTDFFPGMYLNFMYTNLYKIPQVLKSIAADTGEAITKTSQGLSIQELKQENLIGQNIDQIMMQWGMQAYTNPNVFANTVKYIDKQALFSNDIFSSLKSVNFMLLKLPGMLNLLSRIGKPQTNGIAMQRGNIYTYRTEDYSLATVQNYHPGTYGDRQLIWQAYLGDGDGDTRIFTTHPAVTTEGTPPHGSSPGYWTGSGRLPHSVQERNINMTLYLLPKKKGLMEQELLHTTHAFIPENKFDEFILDENTLFARKGSVYLAVIGNNSLTYSSEEVGSRYDLIQTGQTTYWITELSSADQDHSFPEFIKRLQTNSISLKDDTLSYSSDGNIFELTYGKEFKLNGNLVQTEYQRYESPYSTTDRKPTSISISHDGRELFLDFNAMTREERTEF